jgi:hypothetical protein
MARPTYQTRRAETLALRDTCAPIFLPLFDHMLELAASSHAHGYPQQAGRELAHARKVAAYPVCGCGAPAIRGSALCASHNPDCWRVYDNGGTSIDRYTVCLEVSRWEGHTALYTCLGCSEGGRAFSQFSEAQEGRHLGKRVKLAALDPATRAHIESRLSLEAELALR